MKRFAGALLLLASVNALAASLVIQAPKGASSVAYDINAKGQVAAVLEYQGGRQRGVLSEKGKLTELALSGGGNSDTRAINADGIVVGSAEIAPGTSRAYRFDAAHGMRPLATLGGQSSYGLAINSAGHVAGYADVKGGGYHAFVDNGTSMADLGTLGGGLSFANAINNKGQVAGASNMRDVSRHAFLFDPARGMIDLGTLGGRSSAAAAINDAGWVVGASETRNGRWHAFLHDGQKMIDLGALAGDGDSYANGINNAGQVAGTLQTKDERFTWVWQAGKMTLYRGGQGLFQVNRLTEAGLVVGAIRGTQMEAAIMSADAIPQEAPNELRAFVPVAILCMLAAGAIVIWRKRYRGLSWRQRMDRR